MIDRASSFQKMSQELRRYKIRLVKTINNNDWQSFIFPKNVTRIKKMKDDTSKN